MNRPSFSNVSFTNNSAYYGPDIASYPFKIVNKGTMNNKIVLDDSPSGIFLSKPLEFDIIDYDGQVVLDSNNDIVKITPITQDVSVGGYDFSVIVNGTVQFDNIQFQAPYGSQNVTYGLYSKQIEMNMLTEVFNYTNYDLSNLLMVYFRD